MRFITADVFTDRPYGGNQLAVVFGGEGLSTERMLDITREFNYSETVFVLPPERGGTRRLRIFTPGAEVPFAGHPTVGTAFALAATGEIELQGDETAIVLEEGVGPVPVTIRAAGGRPTFAQLSVAKLPEQGPPAPSRERLAAMLSLEPQDLVAGWGAAGWSCGLPFLFVPVASLDAVRRSRVRLDRWEETLRDWWTPDVFVFATEGERPGSHLHARMYAPALGVPEDPATGSACAALAGCLVAREASRAPLADGTRRWTVEQGFEMGRPSIIEVEADVANGAVVAVRVGGASVLMSEGRLLAANG